MLCENCKSREATVHFTKIVNNEKMQVNLCDECAKKYQEQFTIGIESNFPIQQFLTSLFTEAMETTSRDRTFNKEPKCPVCNLTYSNFANIGKLGCSYCYEFYEDRLESILKRIHGSTRHTGKFPSRTGGKLKIKQEIKDLKFKLKELVAEEKFENAAEVRDKIKELEKGL